VFEHVQFGLPKLPGYFEEVALVGCIRHIDRVHPNECLESMHIKTEVELVHLIIMI